METSSVSAAMMRMRPPQAGHRVPSMSETRASKQAQVRRCARAWGEATALGSTSASSVTGGAGTICWRWLVYALGGCFDDLLDVRVTQWRSRYEDRRAALSGSYVDAVEHEDVKMRVEIYRTAKSLHEGH